MTALAIVRRDAVRLPSLRPAAPAPAPVRDAPPEPVACGACSGTDCTPEKPCCEACTHAAARAEPAAEAPAAAEPGALAAPTDTQAREAAPTPGPAPSAPAAAASRVRTFCASDESVDRYNTVLKASGWQLENFRKNPVILCRHSSYDWPIGKGTPRVVGKRLLIDIEFFGADLNPDADMALRMLDAGVMGVSVGFRPLAYEYNKEREAEDPWENLFNPPLDYTELDLLEVSVVTIGGNPNAVPLGRALPAGERAAGAGSQPVPIEALARLVPELVRKAVAEVSAELSASRAQRRGRIS